MSKVVTSPIDRFPGEVVLSDPLNFPQLLAYEEAVGNMRGQDENSISEVQAISLLLPGVLPCVEEFRIQGIPPKPTIETYPSTPTRAIVRFTAWLIGEVRKVILGAEEVPNG